MEHPFNPKLTINLEIDYDSNLIQVYYYKEVAKRTEYIFLAEGKQEKGDLKHLLKNIEDHIFSPENFSEEFHEWIEDKYNSGHYHILITSINSHLPKK